MSIESRTQPGNTEGAPRTRWAAIVWGAMFAAVAICGLWLFSDDGRRTGIHDWAATLTPTMITVIALLTIGVLVLVAGAVGLVRRAQRHLATARPTS